MGPTGWDRLDSTHPKATASQESTPGGGYGSLQRPPSALSLATWAYCPELAPEAHTARVVCFFFGISTRDDTGDGEGDDLGLPRRRWGRGRWPWSRPVEKEQLAAVPAHVPVERDQPLVEPACVPVEQDRRPVEPACLTVEQDRRPGASARVPNVTSRMPVEQDRAPVAADRVPVEPSCRTCSRARVPVQPSCRACSRPRVPVEWACVPCLRARRTCSRTNGRSGARAPNVKTPGVRGPEQLWLAQPAQLAPDQKEGLLQGILRQLGIAGQPMQITEQRLLEPVEELGESLPVPRLGAEDEKRLPRTVRSGREPTERPCSRASMPEAPEPARATMTAIFRDVFLEISDCLRKLAPRVCSQIPASVEEESKKASVW